MENCEIFDKHEEVKITAIDMATELQYNIKAEANAITDYNRLLDMVNKAEDIKGDQKLAIIGAVYEIIGDELNHQNVLENLYSLITGIKAKTD